MLGRMYDNEECSAARALELIGERWTLLIIRNALYRNHTRFTQFQKSLAIAPNILTKRLNDLVDNKILETRVSADRPDHREYALTEMGRGLKPVVMALTIWGDEWVRPGPAVFVHEGCDAEVVQRFSCPRCEEAVEAADVQAIRRPVTDG